MADEAPKLTMKDIVLMTYPEQAQMYLNLYWDEMTEKGEDTEAVCEEVWKWTQLFSQLDEANGLAGCDLDEFNAHRFLEKQGEHKTVVQMREELRQIDQDFNKRMALIEYILFKHKKTVPDLEAKPQVKLPPELAVAKEALAAVQSKIKEMNDKQDALRKKVEEHEAAGAQAKANIARGELKKLEDDGVPDDIKIALIKAESDLKKAQKNVTDAPLHGSSWWAVRSLEEMKKYKPKGGLKVDP